MQRIGLLVVVALVLSVAGEAFAQSGFGPRPGTRGSAGPARVVAAKTVATEAANLVADVTGGASGVTEVAQDTFSDRVQVRMTAPSLKSIDSQLRKRRSKYRAISAVGLELRAGSSKKVSPKRGIRMSLTGKITRRKGLVVAAISKGKVRRLKFTRKGDTISFTLKREERVALLVPR
jgi:hypothetical protein